MGSTVFGIKIILQDKASPVAENTTIGLYNVAADNSEFRWIQNAISGVNTWKEGIIIRGGIRPFSNEIDLTRGGAVAYPGKGSVVVDNTINIYKTIDDLGIKFDGLIAEIYVFYGTLPVRLRTYACKEIAFDGNTATIPFEGNKRVSNILNVVNSYQFPNSGNILTGTIIPAAFGKLCPTVDSNGTMLIDSVAKFIRTQDRYDEDSYTNATLTTEGLYTDIKIFPVVQLWLVNNEVCGVQIELNGTSIFPEASTQYPSDTYLLIVTGTGSAEGIINEVDYIEGSSTANYLNIFCKNVFKVTPSFANDSTRSWIKIVKIYRNYNADTWPCKAFINDVATEVTKPILYTADSNNNLKRIADFGLTVVNTEKNNALDINGSQYNSDIDTLESFIALPITSIELETEDAADFGRYDAHHKIWTAEGSGVESDCGIYVDKEGSFLVTTPSFSNSERAYNKVSDEYAYFTAQVNLKNILGLFVNAFKFTLPKLPKGIDIDSFYIGVKLDATVLPDTSGYARYYNLGIDLKRFAYSQSDDFIDTVIDTFTEIASTGGVKTVNAENQLEQYWLDTVVTEQNRRFYIEKNSIASQVSTLNGYTLIEIPNCTKDIYNTFISGDLYVVSQTGDNFPSMVDVKIYDVSIILKLTSSSMKDYVFSPLAGRIYNSTFDGRKTASDLISKPQDLLEHLCRLQNYSDKYPTPASGWGLQYASGALIHTASFDQISDTREPATQIFDLDDGYTDKIKQTLCREMALANWQDANGYERILALPTYKLDPVHTVTLDDVMDRSKIKVFDFKRESIYAEPFVRYQKNPATGDYEKMISVKNASSTYYMAQYVDGVENAAEAEDLWRTCHSLSLKAHQVNKPPTDMTDLQWANGPGGYTIALRHIQDWVRWQGLQEIEFPVHFNLAASWQECTPINILFSHHTGNVSRAALVERSEITPNHPYDVMIKAVLYA